MEQPEQFPVLVGVFDTEDGFALGMATHSLWDAGIIYDVVKLNLPPTPHSDRPKFWVPPCRILVSVDDEKDAREIIEPYLHPLPKEELESDGPSD